MKIKKISNSVGLVGNVTNQYSESTQDSYSCDYINKIVKENIYSTEEVQIGKWIDNKPLYRKTINIGTITANTQKTGTTGINGLEIMIQSTTTCLYPNGAWHTISPNDAFVYNNGANYSVIDSSNSTKCTMTILYTKTTDSPSS